MKDKYSKKAKWGKGLRVEDGPVIMLILAAVSCVTVHYQKFSSVAAECTSIHFS